MKRIVSIVTLCCFLVVGGGLAAFKVFASESKNVKKKSSGPDEVKPELSIPLDWGSFKISFREEKLPNSRVASYPLELTQGGAVKGSGGKYTMGAYKCSYKTAFRVTRAGGGLSAIVVKDVFDSLSSYGLFPDGWGLNQNNCILADWTAEWARVIKTKGGKTTLGWDFPLIDIALAKYVVSFSRPFGGDLSGVTSSNDKQLYYTRLDPATGKPLVDKDTSVVAEEQSIDVSPGDLVVTVCIDAPSAPSFASKAKKK